MQHKTAFILVFILASLLAPAQQKTQVMTLGVFHFDFPNMDVVQVDKTNQIDVLDSVYQHEINMLVNSLKNFRPTKIVIESEPAYQPRYDSLYTVYLTGQHTLTRNEIQQVGFRLAKELNHKKIYCADAQGRFYESLEYLFSENEKSLRFDSFYLHNPDTVYYRQPRQPAYATKGIIADLIERNTPDTIQVSLGYYLTSLFKFEQEEGDFTGVDFETCRWFSRNLRIYRNIQRLKPTPADRILVIFGAEHLNILNYLFDCSFEFERVSLLPYLEKALK